MPYALALGFFSGLAIISSSLMISRRSCYPCHYESKKMLDRFLKKIDSLGDEFMEQVIKNWAENQPEMTEEEEDRIVAIYKENLIKRQREEQRKKQ